MSYVRPDEALPKPLELLIEEARLATLERYRTLSARDLEGLSRLAREAATSLGATQAAISFVDSTRVWFGGAFGFGAGDAAREGSFCDAVVRSAAPLVVPDARGDPRFWSHALIRGAPGLRSYAGVPLVDGGGYTLGTVAVYSVSPSRFTAEILPELTGVATLVRDFLADACQPEGQARGPVRGVQGWFGVKALSAETADAGLVIVSVKRGSPADEAGLRPTDIIHSLGGQELRETADIAAALAGRVAGSWVRLRFRRARNWHECDVEVRPRRRLFSGK